MVRQCRLSPLTNDRMQRKILPMTYPPMSYPPVGSRNDKSRQDDRKLFKHMEREQESKKLAVLIERVRRQLAQQQSVHHSRVA